MEVKAKLRYLRVSPRKVRLVAGLIRGKATTVALDQLQFSGKGAALPMSKLLKSAVANAVNNFDLAENNLAIKEVFVDGGPTLKRWLPRAHGRATPLNKRTSHITIVLKEIKDGGVKVAKKQTLEAPIKLGALAEQANQGIEAEKKHKVGKPGDKAESEDKTDESKTKIGRTGHKKIEGGSGKKGFATKLFQRKSG